MRLKSHFNLFLSRPLNFILFYFVIYSQRNLMNFILKPLCQKQLKSPCITTYRCSSSLAKAGYQDLLHGNSYANRICHRKVTKPCEQNNPLPLKKTKPHNTSSSTHNIYPGAPLIYCAATALVIVLLLCRKSSTQLHLRQNVTK